MIPLESYGPLVIGLRMDFKKLCGDLCVAQQREQYARIERIRSSIEALYEDLSRFNREWIID